MNFKHCRFHGGCDSCDSCDIEEYENSASSIYFTNVSDEVWRVTHFPCLPLPVGEPETCYLLPGEVTYFVYVHPMDIVAVEHLEEFDPPMGPLVAPRSANACPMRATYSRESKAQVTGLRWRPTNNGGDLFFCDLRAELG